MTHNRITKKFLYAFFLSIILWSCDEGEPDDMKLPADEPGTISAYIDGDFFRSHGFSPVSASLKTDVNGVNQYRVSFEAEAEDNGIEQRITFSIWGTDFDSVKAGDSYSAGDEVGYGGNRFDGDFYRTGRSVEFADLDDITDSEQTSASTLSITAIDHENRLISGTFKFKSIDIFGSGLTFDITDGKFTEIQY